MSHQYSHNLSQTSILDLSPPAASQPSSITEDMWDSYDWPAVEENPRSEREPTSPMATCTQQDWSEEEQCAQGTPTESQMPTDSQMDSIMNWRPIATSRAYVPAAAPHRNIL